jgi:hypothetical protein
MDKDGFLGWIKPKMHLYRLGCCDCGLVHDMKFKVIGKRVYIKAKRNNRSTAQKRRGSKHWVWEKIKA